MMMTQAKRGRPKGSANKVTNEAKRALLMAFEGLGGVQRLIDWVNADAANETLFWTKVFPKLLPRPAIDAAPAPEALPPVKGALVWKVPDWAKQAKEATRRARLQAGIAEGASAISSAARGDRPRSGELDP